MCQMINKLVFFKNRGDTKFKRGGDKITKFEIVKFQFT